MFLLILFALLFTSRADCARFTTGLLVGMTIIGSTFSNCLALYLPKKARYLR